MNQEVLRDLSYGVYVVTTLCPESQKPAGCIANSIMQVTYDTIAVSINHENFTNSCIKESGKFAISILGETVADNIIPVFGFQSARNVDKFVGIKTKNIDGLEIIEDSVGYIICDVINRMDTSTHTIFLGKIKDGDIIKQGTPMTYAYYQTVKKGHSPKTAPTYMLSLCIQTIPTGIIYALWSGFGIIGIAVLGWIVHKQTLDLPAIAGIVLILLGVLVIKIFSKSIA